MRRLNVHVGKFKLDYKSRLFALGVLENGINFNIFKIIQYKRDSVEII